MNLILPTKVEIKYIEGKGYGVFATEVITPGEIIEECHLVSIPQKDIDNKEILPDYRFSYPKQFYAIKHIFPKQEICTYYGNVEYWEGLKYKNIKLI